MQTRKQVNKNSNSVDNYTIKNKNGEEETLLFTILDRVSTNERNNRACNWTSSSCTQTSYNVWHNALNYSKTKKWTFWGHRVYPRIQLTTGQHFIDVTSR